MTNLEDRCNFEPDKLEGINTKIGDTVVEINNSLEISKHYRDNAENDVHAIDANIASLTLEWYFKIPIVGQFFRYFFMPERERNRYVKIERQLKHQDFYISELEDREKEFEIIYQKLQDIEQTLISELGEDNSQVERVREQLKNARTIERYHKEERLMRKGYIAVLNQEIELYIKSHKP